MNNRVVTTEITQNVFDSIDDIIDNREKNKGEEVEISDGLIAKYDVNIFDGSSSDLSADKYSAHLFYEKATVDDSLSQNQTAGIFGIDTSYSQSNVTANTRDYAFIVLWIAMCLVICALILKIIEKRKERAKKNRNRIQVQTLYS